MTEASIPSYTELLWPVLEAVRTLGGSGSIDEITEAVIEAEGFTEEQQQVLSSDGSRTLIEYRLAWARTYLWPGDRSEHPVVHRAPVAGP